MRTTPAADWEEIPGTWDSRRMSQIIGRHMKAAPTSTSADRRVKSARWPRIARENQAAVTTPTIAPGKVA